MFKWRGKKRTPNLKTLTLNARRHSVPIPYTGGVSQLSEQLNKDYEALENKVKSVEDENKRLRTSFEALCEERNENGGGK